MFSAELSYRLEAAFREAVIRKNSYLCVEHIVYALLHDKEVEETLGHCGANIKQLKQLIDKYLDTYIEKLPDNPAEDQDAEPIQTPAVKRVLERSLIHQVSAQKPAVTSVDLMIAIMSEEDTYSVQILNKQGVSRLSMIEYVSHGLGSLPKKRSQKDSFDQFDEEDEFSEGVSGSFLEKFTEELTSKARAGELDPVIGREEEIEKALRVLVRRQKNNPLFIGEPGVGKTALANALAQKLISDECPSQLKGCKLFTLELGNLIAGTKFRGEFEDRLRKLVSELKENAPAILFIDEIHTLVGAGATGSSSMDAANLLKPALASGELRCVGSTTFEDYKKSFEKDRALNRRFSAINLDEPTVAETIKILEGLKDKFEEHHSVKFSSAALKAAAELSARFIMDRFLPDKAIDVIDEAGAANSLLSASKRKKSISENDIEKIVSVFAKAPVKTVSSSDQIALGELNDKLLKRVFGQDKAVEAVVKAIKRSRASLKSDTKPVGCFLFAGPTGVGKTELAKVLADELSVGFHRFDMSEYMEKHAVARLVGSPPGYVGYEEGGQLTDLIRRNPYCVLLMDEIEKAHPDIFNILLQVMDAASLTDSQGKKADFKNVILIMTTNAGSETASSIGFARQGAVSVKDDAIKKLFRPEFRNRLDEIVYFASLSQDMVLKVVDKFIVELEEQLKDRKIRFTLTEDARKWLAEKGFDPQMGARPMARLIQKEIKDQLADKILFGELKDGGLVNISLDNEQLEFKCSSN